MDNNGQENLARDRNNDHNELMKATTRSRDPLAQERYQQTTARVTGSKGFERRRTVCGILMIVGIIACIALMSSGSSKVIIGTWAFVFISWIGTWWK
jgi:hypothetical protein